MHTKQSVGLSNGIKLSETTILNKGAAESTLLNGLVFSALLNESSGNRLDSVGGNVLVPANTPTQGAALATNLSNSAVFVAASTQYLHDDTPSAGIQFGDVDFTVAFWCKATADGAFVGRWYTTTADRSWVIDRASGAIRFGMSPDGGVGSYHAVSGGAMASGAVYFVVCYHDAANNLIYTQLNNGTPSSTAHTGGAYAASTAAITIGATANPALHLSGSVSDVLMWNRLLTADEKTELYNGGDGNPYPFL